MQGFTLTLALNIQRIPNNEQPSESQPSEDIKAVANNTQSNSVTAANINTINLIASKTKKQKHTTTISTVNLNTQAPPEQVAKTESLELHTLLPAQNVAPFPKYKGKSNLGTRAACRRVNIRLHVILFCSFYCKVQYEFE